MKYQILSVKVQSILVPPHFSAPSLSLLLRRHCAVGVVFLHLTVVILTARLQSFAGTLILQSTVLQRALVTSIGVARIFDWGGGAKPQITCNDVIKNFQKRTFCGAKILYNGRSEAVAWWHLTRIFVKGEIKHCVSKLVKSGKVKKCK